MSAQYLTPRVDKPAIVVITQAVKSRLIWFEGADCALAKDANFKDIVYCCKDLN